MDSVLIPKTAWLVLACTLPLLSSTGTARDWGSTLKQRAEQRAGQHLQQAVDSSVDAVADTVTKGPDAQGTTQKSSDGTAARDRFTPIIEQAPKSSVQNGALVNHKRVAVQEELAQRPPTRGELGVELPAGARLELYETALQIAQYHPAWRVYKYRLDTPRERGDFIDFFTSQGLHFNERKYWIIFPAPPGVDDRDAEFIDLSGDPVEGFRIWRRPGAG